MANEADFRKQVGVILRAPVVLILGLLWVVYVWWWVAGLGVAAGLAMLLLHPIAYPIAYALTWLAHAFENSSEPVLPNYWEVYPDRYVDLCMNSLRLGFPTLQRWLLTGFD